MAGKKQIPEFTLHDNKYILKECSNGWYKYGTEENINSIDGSYEYGPIDMIETTLRSEIKEWEGKYTEEVEMAKYFLDYIEQLPRNTMEIERTTVAIESIRDYVDPSVGFNIINGVGNQYRLVTIGEEGHLVPYPDNATMFQKEEDIQSYIDEHLDEIDVISYDNMVHRAEDEIIKNNMQKRQFIQDAIHSLEFDDEGYLHFAVRNQEGYDYEGIYRVCDPENGPSRTLVSFRSPGTWSETNDAFRENYEEYIMNYLRGYVKENPLIGMNGEEIPREKASIYCEWSEHSAFEDGKVYSISEFDKLMKEADAEWMEKHKEWVTRINNEFGGVLPSSEELHDLKPEELIGYSQYCKTKFTIYLPDRTPITQRQDIGDGYGGVVDYFKKYYQGLGATKIAEELEAAIEQEVTMPVKIKTYSEHIHKLNVDIARLEKEFGVTNERLIEHEKKMLQELHEYKFENVNKNLDISGKIIDEMEGISKQKCQLIFERMKLKSTINILDNMYGHPDEESYDAAIDEVLENADFEMDDMNLEV